MKDNQIMWVPNGLIQFTQFMSRQGMQTFRGTSCKRNVMISTFCRKFVYKHKASKFVCKSWYFRDWKEINIVIKVKMFVFQLFNDIQSVKWFHNGVILDELYMAPTAAVSKENVLLFFFIANLMSKCKASFLPSFLKTSAPTVSENSSLPTAAIVFIVIGAYIVVFTVGVLIRQCLLVY